MKLEAEVEIGNYTLLERKGSGDYGEVWKAKQKGTGRIVALKVLHPSIKKEKLDMLQKESKVLGRLVHTNIVGCIEFCHEHCYLAMEYVEGCSLQELLKKKALERKWIELDKALEIIRNCLEALKCAQDERVVHGDIKLENIMIPDRGQAKLTDFGVARNLGTPASRFKGSSTYAAPEVLKDWKEGESWSGDYRADLFSVGVVSYLLLTARHPFLHESGVLSIQEAIESDYEPLPLTQSHELPVPKTYLNVVMKLLRKEINDRYASAFNALKALDEPPLICPNCQYLNESKARFCANCRASLEIEQGLSEMEIMYNESQKLLRERRPEKAVEVLEKMLGKYNQFAKGWSLLAYTQNYMRNYEAAIEAAKMAVKADPRLCEGYHTMGFAKSHLTRYDEAISDFTTALQYIDPKDNRRKSQIFSSRAFTYMLAGRYEKACEDARKALELDSTNERAKRLIKKVCDQM